MASRFTDAANKFLLANWQNFTSKELSEMLSLLFGIEVATQTVTDQLLRLGIHRGSNFIPRGHKPKGENTCAPIGTERIRKRTVYVKVKQPNEWKPKAAVVMEYDPRHFQAIFLDGNPLNVVPENIVVVNKKIHARLAKNGWLNSNSDILMAGIKWSELLYVLKEMEDIDGKT